jgi:hypothetical protein
MNATQPVDVKKIFLYALIFSVALSAILGIGAILSGSWSWYEVRVLLTTFTVALASICGLANGAYLITGRGRALPLVGIGLALVAAALVIGGMWLEPPSDPYWKLTAALCIFAVACAHLSLLSMARLAHGYQWSLVSAYVVILGVAGLIVLLIVGDVPGGPGYFQLLAVAAIIDAALTILVPVFQWLSHGQVGSSVESLDAEIARLKTRLAELEQRRASLAP